jgi:hypothetical protein
MMSVQRKRKLTLGKTTLRLLSLHQLEAVVAGDVDPVEPVAGQDSYRGCGVNGLTNHTVQGC